VLGKRVLRGIFGPETETERERERERGVRKMRGNGKGRASLLLFSIRHESGHWCYQTNMVVDM
jgi:hypothetical protein